MDPRPASTVILVRAGHPSGIEVFMLRRSAQSPFAPDAYVFPGGTVDASDRDSRAHERTTGIEETRLRALFRMDVPPDAILARSLVVAALRELFEESGILFACADGTPIVEYDPGERHFFALLEARGWTADARPLELFSRWITPESIAPRFDAYFFVARVPHAQTPIADAYETHDGIWISPADALRRCAEGRFHVIYPTRKHLERLRAFESVDALMTFAREKEIRTVRAAGDDGHGFALPTQMEGTW